MHHHRDVHFVWVVLLAHVKGVWILKDEICNNIHLLNVYLLRFQDVVWVKAIQTLRDLEKLVRANILCGPLFRGALLRSWPLKSERLKYVRWYLNLLDFKLR